MILAHGCACVQVLTSQDEFAAVRDKLLELGLTVDHDHSGLVFAPLTTMEVLPFCCLTCQYALLELQRFQ